MGATTYNDVRESLRLTIDSATSPEDAMRKTVNLLKEQMPDYTWVGIYLLDGRFDQGNDRR